MMNKSVPPMTAPPVLVPEPGERALIAGQTGSGKTAFAVWLLRRIKNSPIIIYDTKEEPKFNSLPYNSVATNSDEVDKQIQSGESDYIIFRPPVHFSAYPDKLDALLTMHYHNYRGIPAYIDEVYQFHNHGISGPGLQGLLTRGRSRGITLIMSTQRPVFLSNFAITESQRFYLFSLRYKPDRKKIEQIVPNFSDLPLPKKHGFFFYRQEDDKAVQYAPIKLDAGSEQGYTDDVALSASEANSKVLWI